MKRLAACILACMMILGAQAALAGSEISDVAFDMASAYLAGVDFTYPVVDMGDDTQSDALNSRIEADALAPFAQWSEGGTAEGGLIYIHREGDILSLGYQVEMVSPQAAYPVMLFYAGVYDVKTAAPVSLGDFADAGKIAALLAGGAGLAPGLDLSEEAVFDAQVEYVAGLGQDAVLKMLENEGYAQGQDPSLSQAFFLLGAEDELYVALSVPHAIGDWAVFLLSKAELAK